MNETLSDKQVAQVIEQIDKLKDIIGSETSNKVHTALLGNENITIDDFKEFLWLMQDHRFNESAVKIKNQIVHILFN